jgi:hypothetical protein
MNFNFDTATLTEIEARGIMALLSILFPPPLLTVTSNLASLAAPATVTSVEAVQASIESQESPSPIPARRGRRTNAQIAADEAAAKAQGQTQAPSDPTPASVGFAQGSAALDAAASGTTESATAASATAPAKPISADELRALLNAFISKHSMEEAIEKLRSFGCNRVTEALALEPAKLNELAVVLNG